MLRISKKHSLTLSMALAVIFFLGCLASAIVMPKVVDALLLVSSLLHGLGNLQESTVFILLMVLAYAMLAIAALADVLLMLLLLRVRRGLVFSRQSTDLVRSISWCCMLLALLCLGMGYFFRLALVIAFAGALLGICLRVVKNVLEEATELKSENELTI